MVNARRSTRRGVTCATKLSQRLADFGLAVWQLTLFTGIPAGTTVVTCLLAEEQFNFFERPRRRRILLQ